MVSAFPSIYCNDRVGNWLPSEDKEFCYLQVYNKGAMEYSTGKIAVPFNSCLQVFRK